MIKQPKNWNEVQAFSDRPTLPLGAYVCKVLKVTVENTSYGSQLQIGFDIAEGEYKNFFRKEFDANTSENKKWKGVLRVWLPKDDGSANDEITKRVLKGVITSFEKSNTGYFFNWDEKTLVGKSVGILFRNKEWEYNGKRGWAVRPFRAISVDTVRNGEFRLPEDKPLNNSNRNANTAPVNNTAAFTPVTDDETDDLPF